MHREVLLAGTMMLFLLLPTTSEAAVAAGPAPAVAAVVRSLLTWQWPTLRQRFHGPRPRRLAGIATRSLVCRRCGPSVSGQLLHQLRGRRTDDPGRLYCERHTNVPFAEREAYRARLRSSAPRASLPGSKADWITAVAEKVSEQVASHTKLFPLLHGNSASPCFG